MTAFISAVLRGLNKTTTENGAISHRETLDPVLDFFSKAGALRDDHEQALEYFEKAFDEDKSLAMKALFYIRDIRGGQGERETFRSICSWLAMNHPEVIIRNIPYIPTYGRWDDLYALVPIDATRTEALTFMKAQFDEDMKSDSRVSLLGKWLKSENASSEETKRLGAITRKFFNLSSRDYRKALTSLRQKIDVVESHMSGNEWDQINYQAVPSNAMKIYAKAFSKHDGERYMKYLAEVAKGEKKINAGALYPYDIVHRVLRTSDKIELKSLNLQWDALPNYLENAEDLQSIVVADVSGSMYIGNPTPIDVSISIALYFAERIKGPFGGYFLTFSSSPELVKVRGASIGDKVKNMQKANWGNTTDLNKAFKMILDFAVENKVPADQMPKRMFVISDMQFDAATDPGATNFNDIDRMYEEHGYVRPIIIFWDVNARAMNTPVTKDDKGTYLVSGCSPSILKYALNSKAISPVEFMLEVLQSERYKPIY